MHHILAPGVQFPPRGTNHPGLYNRLWNAMYLTIMHEVEGDTDNDLTEQAKYIEDIQNMVAVVEMYAKKIIKKEGKVYFPAKYGEFLAMFGAGWFPDCWHPSRSELFVILL
jgi:hypothetical protein